MALKVNQDGKFEREKKIPKYYEPRIEWVEITPEMADKYLKDKLSWRKCTEIGKSIRYSTESIAKVFRNPPQKVNKIIWDAIVVNVKEPS